MQITRWQVGDFLASDNQLQDDGGRTMIRKEVTTTTNTIIAPQGRSIEEDNDANKEKQQDSTGNGDGNSYGMNESPGGASAPSQSDKKKKPYNSLAPFTIFPVKQFTITGKKSSGTQFVTRIIRDALKQRTYREGEFPNKLLEDVQLHGNR